MLGKGDFARRLWVADTSNQTTGRWGCGLRHRLAGQQLVERFGEIAARRLGAGIANAELIVDPALVANHSSAIEHKNFWRPARGRRR